MPPDRRPTTWKAALLGLLLFVAGDVLLFRTGLYAWITEPNSSAGFVARRTQVDEGMLDPAPLEIAVVGDSRAGEAVWPQRFDELWPGDEVELRGLWIPGTSPRVWCHLLERLDPDGGRFPVVVVPLTSYDDYDLREDMAERVYDLAFLGPMIGYWETPEVVDYFVEPENRREALLVGVCKWYALRRDLRDLAAAPWKRYQRVRRSLADYRWGSSVPGHEEDLSGVRVEGDRIVGLPDDAPEALVRELRAMAVGQFPEDRGRYLEYRRRWLGRIVRHQAGTRTRVVFLRMPTQVLPRREPRPPHGKVLAELGAQPHVHVLPRDTFSFLESPEYFFDALHVNARGRAAFTRRLTEVLQERFGQRLER